MKPVESHLADRELLMAMDGELAPRDVERVKKHLAACWTCRSRRVELERAIADFVHLHGERMVPPSVGPRALLKANLASINRQPRRSLIPMLAMAAAAAGVAIAAWFGATRWIPERHRSAAVVLVPNPALTPGAAVLLSRNDVCRVPQPNNKDVPVALQRRVLEEYGLGRDEARAYEVDYLITPALGGADDIHNMWPQPYRDAQWNAHVKDALEERLRMMVCEGEVDLSTAQREIASNWIEAYKKYFGTDHPIEYGNP